MTSTFVFPWSFPLVSLSDWDLCAAAPFSEFSEPREFRWPFSEDELAFCAWPRGGQVNELWKKPGASWSEGCSGQWAASFSFLFSLSSYLSLLHLFHFPFSLILLPLPPLNPLSHSLFPSHLSSSSRSSLRPVNEAGQVTSKPVFLNMMICTSSEGRGSSSTSGWEISRQSWARRRFTRGAIDPWRHREGRLPTAAGGTLVKTEGRRRERWREKLTKYFFFGSIRKSKPQVYMHQSLNVFFPSLNPLSLPSEKLP